MPITITKTKPQATTSTEVVMLSDNAAKIDEIGRLQNQLDAAQAALEKVAKKEVEKVADLTKKLKKALEELNPLLQMEFDEDPDLTKVALGAKFQADLGKKGNEREVTDIKMIHDILEEQQKGLFFQMATVPLGKLDAYLTPQEKEATITTKRGKRTIKIGKRV